MPLPCAVLRRNRRCALWDGSMVNSSEKPSVRHTAGFKNSTAWGRRETRGSTNNVVTSDLALMCVYPFLPLSLSYSPHLLLPCRGVRENEDSPQFSLAIPRMTSQNPSLISADFSGLLNVYTQRWVCMGSPISTPWLMWGICHRWAREHAIQVKVQ